MVNQVDEDLKDAKVKATVTGRPKHYYSIYQKMILGGREFTDIYDLVGLRVLVDEDRDCYSVLGVLHSRWNPVLGRFKDYVAMPKFNMYQSLHTTVIGPQGKPVEIQIRTRAMHRRAEYGVAAHWKYKEDGRNGVDTDQQGDLDDMSWVRQLLDWQSEVEDPGEFLESLRFEINRAEVYVFTPRGDVIALPLGATPVDFAYAVHTEVGHHTIGARVNGRLVPLESTLENSDVVEIFTSKAATAGPSQDWLGFVKSPRARSKIRQWFTKERREEAIERGKEQIAKLMRKEGLPLKRVLSHESLTQAAIHFKIADVTALYASVGEGNLSAQAVVRRVIELHGGDEGPPRTSARASRSPAGGAAPRRPAPAVTPGSSCVAPATCGSSSPSAARRCRPTRSSGSSPRAAGSRCTAATAPTPPACSASPRSCSTSSGHRPPSRRSWSTSRSRPSTGPGCSPTSPWSSRTPT